MSKDPSVTDATPTQAGKVTSADGTAIAYEKLGSGPALVLVDGALCYRDFGPARGLAARLHDRYTVYFYDRRGRGGSGDTLPYDVQKEIDDLAAVVAATGETPFVLGLSSGGGLALEAAAAGVPMAAVAAYESPYVGLRPGKNGEPRDYLGELRALLAEGKRGPAVDYFMVKMVRGPWFLPLMMRLMPKVWKQLTSVAPTLEYDARVMHSFTAPTERFATIAVPTLVMGGSKSPAEMLDAQTGIAGAIPGSEYRILVGQTHQVSAAALDPVIDGFFTEHR